MRALASRAMTVKDLAEEFEITRRQVYRDIDRIQEEGHPLEQSDGESEKTWQLPLGYKGLPPITLSPYELMSLQLARADLAYLNGTPFIDDLDQTLAKLRAALPHKTVNHLDRILKVFAPLPKPLRNYSRQASLLRDLRKALLLQLRVDLEYVKPGESDPARYRVDPYALVLHQHGLYLTAYSHTSEGDRLFLVDRMKTITLSEERFDLPANYSPAERFTKSFGLIEETPQRYHVACQRGCGALFSGIAVAFQPADYPEEGRVIVSDLHGRRLGRNRLVGVVLGQGSESARSAGAGQTDQRTTHEELAALWSR